MSVELIGPYHADCDGGGGTHRRAIGWGNLTVGDYRPGKHSQVRIDDDEGAIGWAPLSSIRLKGITVIYVGAIITVVG
jgi:hypothetical protein